MAAKLTRLRSPSRCGQCVILRECGHAAACPWASQVGPSAFLFNCTSAACLCEYLQTNAINGTEECISPSSSRYSYLRVSPPHSTLLKNRHTPRRNNTRSRPPSQRKYSPS